LTGWNGETVTRLRVPFGDISLGVGPRGQPASLDGGTP
jgi:hypothetical protein